MKKKDLRSCNLELKSIFFGKKISIFCKKGKKESQILQAGDKGGLSHRPEIKDLHFIFSAQRSNISDQTFH